MFTYFTVSQSIDCFSIVVGSVKLAGMKNTRPRFLSFRASVCVRACERARACVLACVCVLAYVCVCVCVCVCVWGDRGGRDGKIVLK